MKYESTFNAIDGILRNEAGCSNELDYIEQTSWLLFLKYLDDLETSREMEALADGKEYKRLITGFHRWSSWAAPKTDKGEIDVVNAMTGDDLVDFVNNKLFPALKHFKDTAPAADTLEYKIGEIFSELRNKINSGYNMREIINKIDTLQFQSAEDQHEMTVLYEDKIRRMGNAGRNGGEYYTPRPLIRTIVQVVNPRIGETVYDPACGSAGFLCEAFNYMNEQVKSVADDNTLQKNTFFGKEKKGLPYIIATMNMIFHGVAAPNIVRGNTLAENLTGIMEKDRKNVILANPPFGGSERAEVQQNFDIKTSETAYMFMQHFIKMLKVNGRAGIVIKNTFLSNGDAAGVRRKLLEECNLHTILDLPSGVFTGAGVKTVVLFFTKGEPTRKIWYYQLNLPRTLGKTNPLTEEDLAEFVELQKTKPETENSWTIDVDTLGEDCDLSVKNPNKPEVIDDRTPADIIASIADLNKEADDLIGEIVNLMTQNPLDIFDKIEGKKIKLGDAANIYNGDSINAEYKKKHFVGLAEGYPFIATKDVDYHGNIDYNNGVKIPFSAGLKIAPKNSVFVCAEGGNAGKKVAYVEYDVCFGNKLYCINPKDITKYNAKFIYYFCRSECFKKQFFGELTGLIGGVSTSKFKNISCPFPSIEKQKQIVECLDFTSEKLYRLTAKVDDITKNINDLKQALLKSIFS